MNLSERILQIDKIVGLEGIKMEEKLERLYNLYWDSGDEVYLGYFLVIAEGTCFGIAYCRLASRCSNAGMEFDDCMQLLSENLLKTMRRYYSKGERIENILRAVRHFYKVRSVDLFRKMNRSTDDQAQASLEEMNLSAEGKYMEKVGKEDERADEELLLAKEKAALSQTLVKLYLQDLMASKDDPSHIMALCYARILYQMESRYDRNQIEANAAKIMAKDMRKKYTNFEKMILAIEAAQEVGKTASPGWALERMGRQNFGELKNDSQRVLQSLFDSSLSWQQPYLEKLLQPLCEDVLWKDAVYAEYFDEKQTSAWNKSLHKKIYGQMMQQIAADAELDREVMRLDNPMKTLIKEAGRGRNYDAYDQ